jgi:hypothetical protein
VRSPDTNPEKYRCRSGPTTLPIPRHHVNPTHQRRDGLLSPAGIRVKPLDARK